jgi:NAD-dependent SIR2 family protein deacetylase
LARSTKSRIARGISLPRHIVILTGAGVSAESGIDTFRSAGGLWEQHRVDTLCRVHTRQSSRLICGILHFGHNDIADRQPQT